MKKFVVIVSDNAIEKIRELASIKGSDKEIIQSLLTNDDFFKGENISIEIKELRV